VNSLVSLHQSIVRIYPRYVQMMNTEKISMVIGGGFALFGLVYFLSSSGVSKDCNSLANKVLSSSSEQSASEGGQLISFSNLKEVSNGEGKIICQGYFEGNGVYRSDTYTISEDKRGVYWRTPGRIEYTQQIEIPHQQVQIEFQDQ